MLTIQWKADIFDYKKLINSFHSPLGERKFVCFKFECEDRPLVPAVSAGCWRTYLSSYTEHSLLLLLSNQNTTAGPFLGLDNNVDIYYYINYVI